MERFMLTRLVDDGDMMLAVDTETGIYCKFKKGEFDATQDFVCTGKANAQELARATRELGDCLSDNYPHHLFTFNYKVAWVNDSAEEAPEGGYVTQDMEDAVSHYGDVLAMCRHRRYDELGYSPSGDEYEKKAKVLRIWAWTGDDSPVCIQSSDIYWVE